jgi:hypothetical protein
MQDVPGSFPAAKLYEAEARIQEDAAEAPVESTYQSISSAVFARKSEYVREKHVRIKIGTWNVAGCKGTEKDIGGWFVGGKGVSERLAGLEVGDANEDRESVETQESRYQRKRSTIPAGDHATLPGDEDVGLYVLALQEIVDLSSAMEALRPYTDPSVINKWKDSMAAALPAGYQLVSEQQLIGLMLLIYAAPDVVPEISSVSTTSVGTGLMNFMGNKGAVTARIVLGETTRLVFINCHLAAGADKAALERRNWDAQQIVARTRFEPIQDAMDLSQTTGEQIGDEDFAFWCGDLNYRLEGIPGDDVRRLLMLHTRNEYDLSQRAAKKIEEELSEATESIHQRLRASSTSTAETRLSTSSHRSSTDARSSYESTQPSTILDEVAESDDPASLQTTLACLLPHDELQQQIKAKKAFHDGWREGPITFLPTYKYDLGSVGVFDTSEKRRAPSWCDRILYRTRRDKLRYEAQVRDEQAARKKDAEMQADGTADLAAHDESILYDYDPNTDGENTTSEGYEYYDYDEYDENDEDDQANQNSNSQIVTTREGFQDEITLEFYTAHQRVLSSDHKPLDAVFSLKYDAVVPELKAKTHAAVAREFDKAENEGRPNVTVVVDNNHNDTGETLPETDEFEGVWFGNVRWGQTKTRTLTIANTSRVAADFSFIERPVGQDQEGQKTREKGIAPSWLQLKINDIPQTSSSESTSLFRLEPGETCVVDLTLTVTALECVAAFNHEHMSTLEEVLVLRIENGRDHFIPVRARWLQSSLGRSIDRLIRIPEGGIRKLQGQNPDGSKKGSRRLRRKKRSNDSQQTETDEAAENSDGDEDDEEEDDDPVRFSAPRELFRLTEVIEELTARVIAEWEMTNPAPITMDKTTSAGRGTSLDTSNMGLMDVTSAQPPWHDVPAWPFDEQNWTERKTTDWQEALSAACDALDSDQPLEASLPPSMTRSQRLYILANLLMVFLQGMPEGVVPVEIWNEIEKYLATRDKSQKGGSVASLDDQRMAVQEIISQKGPNSITFILITSMLERIISEVPHREADEMEHAARAASPLSPTQKLKRFTLLGSGGSSSSIAGVNNAKSGPPSSAADRKNAAIAALAEIFAEAMIKSPPVTGGGGEKARSALQKRKRELVEMFLRRDE